MSGFFGQITGMLSGSGVLSMVPGLLTQVLGTAQGAAGGGLPALLQQFENAGLGEQVKSWLGSGENLPLSAEQVLSAIPPEQLEAWAAKTGLPPEQVAAILAHVLPHAVDHATSNGELPPENGELPDMTTVIGRLFSR
jgi:uncharacterized protein YidB (DUF937 family)